MSELATESLWAKVESQKAVNPGMYGSFDFTVVPERSADQPGDVTQLGDGTEKQRRAIEDVPEEPWRVDASWRAWVALALVLLPTLLSNIFGAWGESLARTLRT